MSGGYQVALGRMGTLISTLEQAKERMTSASAKLKASSPGDLGSREIDSAGGEFQDRWEYGIGKIAEFSGTVAEGLAKAKQVYADMEKKVADQFGKGTGAPGSAPPAAASPSAISARLDGPGR